MPSFRTTRRVGHSPAKMFDLVADVEAYPQFVPMCTALRVRRRGNEGDVDVVLAEMEVGYKAIKETFTSKITLDRRNLRIAVEYIDGPFSRMDNRWGFKPDDEPDAPTCSVEFFIDYQFRNRMLGLLMGSVFDVAFRRFTRAFEARANVVYGASAPATVRR